MTSIPDNPPALFRWIESVLSSILEKHINQLVESGSIEALARIHRGIEKESLRIRPDGQLAQTRHPKALGSPLTHPYITTDFSEALLEFVTPVSTDIAVTLEQLTQIHQFVFANIGDEKLWVNSMPCMLKDDDDVSIAQYGNSNVGQMKHIYRKGLSYRYGRKMQAISGIHYNFSLPQEFWSSYRQNRLADLSLQEFISESYFGLVRNFHKYCWLILYLFGASPAVCKSFLDNNPHGLESFDSHTLHLPFATSLRMSKLGYQNSSQAVVSLCYDSVDEYINCLKQYTETPHPEYEKIGVKRNGEYRQLNANLLQIENEYYSVIRPKRVTLSGEKPSIALADRGVEYVEVRCMDLDPFIPIGIDENQIRFLDIFLLYCLLEESPPIPQPEIKEISENQNLAVTRGREPGIELSNNNKAVKLKGWAGLICQRLEAVAEVLDQAHGSSQYSKVLQGQVEKITHPELTASARILSELETRNISFFRFALEKAEQHERHFKGHLLPKEQRMEYESLAQSSLIQQAEIEHSDKLSFDQFLAEYFAQ